MGVFGYVCYCHRRLTDIPARWPATYSRADGHAGEIRVRQHHGHVRSWWCGYVDPGLGACAGAPSGKPSWAASPLSRMSSPRSSSASPS